MEWRLSFPCSGLELEAYNKGEAGCPGPRDRPARPAPRGLCHTGKCFTNGSSGATALSRTCASSRNEGLYKLQGSSVIVSNLKMLSLWTTIVSLSSISPLCVWENSQVPIISKLLQVQCTGLLSCSPWKGLNHHILPCACSVFLSCPQPSKIFWPHYLSS